jgi:hypothetical protein
MAQQETFAKIELGRRRETGPFELRRHGGQGMPIMTAAAFAAVFAVSTAWAQQVTQRVTGAADCRPGEGDGHRYQGG